MKIYVGMKFKPLSDTSCYGECISLSEERFTYRWYSVDGEPEVQIHDMKIEEAKDCFDYYGWIVLSELEKELI